MVADRYCLLPADLRDIAQLAAALEAAGLDPEAPTLVLSECVLVYLQPQHRCVFCVCVWRGGGLWGCGCG